MVAGCHLFFGFIATVAALASPPMICAWEPPLSLSAGTVVSARIQVPRAARCQAVLQFSDPSFLPITWVFEPIGCAGSEVANFTVPNGVPNGDAFIKWECAGDNMGSCVHVILTNGLGDLDSTEVQQIGTLGCATSPVRTPSTLTTLLASNSMTLSSTEATISTTDTSLSASTTAMNGPVSGVFVISSGAMDGTGASTAMESTVATSATGPIGARPATTEPAATAPNGPSSVAMSAPVFTVTVTTTVSSCQPTHS